MVFCKAKYSQQHIRREFRNRIRFSKFNKMSRYSQQSELVKILTYTQNFLFFFNLFSNLVNVSTFSSFPTDLVNVWNPKNFERKKKLFFHIDFSVEYDFFTICVELHEVIVVDNFFGLSNNKILFLTSYCSEKLVWVSDISLSNGLTNESQIYIYPLFRINPGRSDFRTYNVLFEFQNWCDNVTGPLYHVVL